MQSPAQSRYGLSRGHALASATQRVSCAVQGGGASGTFRARRGDGLCSDNHINYTQSNNSVKKGSSLRRKARRPVMFMRCTTRLIILALALCISSPSTAIAFQVNVSCKFCIYISLLSFAQLPVQKYMPPLPPLPFRSFASCSSSRMARGHGSICTHQRDAALAHCSARRNEPPNWLFFLI